MNGTNAPTSATEYALEVGRRVYSGLYGGRFGVIVNVRGTPGIVPIQRILGGAGVRGGSAYVDVAFDNGTLSPGIPEGIVRGVQWKVLPELVDAVAVEKALATVEETRERAEAEKATANAAFQAEVARLREAAEYAHLDRSDDPKRGIKNVRKELKARWPGTKFSVASRRGYGVGVQWTDGPSETAVGEVLKAYKSKSYNGMDECWEYHRSPWLEVFGGCDFSPCREISDALRERAITKVYQDHPELERIERPTLEDLRRLSGTAMAPVMCLYHCGIRDIAGAVSWAARHMDL